MLSLKTGFDTGKQSAFALDEKGARVVGILPQYTRIDGWEESARLIGADDGKVYVHHHLGYELCGQDEDGNTLDCISKQEAGQAAELVMRLPLEFRYTQNPQPLAIRAAANAPTPFTLPTTKEASAPTLHPKTS